MKHTLAISLSPNVFPSDVLLALKTIWKPLNYNKKDSVIKLEAWFRTYFATAFSFSYVSGRAALYEILKGYAIGEGDEVITQAFTCVALPNAILATGASVVYVDISSNLTMDPKDLQKKITGKTKAIILQHTFGIPSDIESILTMARTHNIKVIEDCAHGIGVPYKGKKLGQFGDAAFFSFGRDKAFSCVFGGMSITNDKKLAEELEKSYKEISYPCLSWTAQQLFHPVAFSLILPLYDFYSFGKMLVVFFQKLRMLSFPVSGEEKKGIYKNTDVKRLPGALATLALAQIERLSEFNKKRELLADVYIKGLFELKKDFPSSAHIPYLRFPFLSEKRDEIAWELRKKHIYVGKWYAHVIDPLGVDFAKIGYTIGMCPNAERVASRILNLPTFPTLEVSDAQRIVRYIKQYA